MAAVAAPPRQVLLQGPRLCLRCALILNHCSSDSCCCAKGRGLVGKLPSMVPLSSPMHAAQRLT